MKIPFLSQKAEDSIKKIEHSIEYDIRHMEESLISLSNVIIKLQNEKRILQEEIASLKAELGRSEEGGEHVGIQGSSDDIILEYGESPLEKTAEAMPAAPVPKSSKDDAIRWLREKHGIEKPSKKKMKKPSSKY